MRSAFSNTVTAWPARASCWAQARPAGPEPTTATRLPVLCDGGSGTIQPSSQPRSTIWHSMVLMVTGLSSMLSVQDASQGAGQMRPVNSGKLLVECSVVERRAPLVAIDQIVPVRDQVVDRTALVAERNAAIHAARGLLAHLRPWQRLDEFVPVLATRFGLFVAAVVALDFQKAGGLAHVYSGSRLTAVRGLMPDVIRPRRRLWRRARRPGRSGRGGSRSASP